MILLRKINLINFLSHTDTNIEFSSEQKILISGKSGSGKSSIVESIIWAFYGKSRTDNHSLIKRGAKSTKVTITLQDENKEFKIERSFGTSHELKIWEKEDEKRFIPIKTKGTKETQEYLEKQILHSSYTLFVNSIIYPQDNAENFAKQNASKRKDIILEIIKASDYDEYLKKAKEELQKVKIDKEVFLTKIESEKAEIINNEQVANKLKEYEKEDIRLQKEIEVLKIDYKKYTDRQKEIEGKKTDIKVIQERLKAKNKEYNDSENRLIELNKKIIELSKIDIEELKKDTLLLKDKKEELNKYNESKDKMFKWGNSYTKILNERPPLNDYNSRIEEINKNLIKLINEKAPQCQKCGFIDPLWEAEHKKDIKYYEDLLQATQDKLKDYKELEIQYENSIKELGKQPVATLNSEDYSKLISEINELEKTEKQLLQADTIEKEIGESSAEIELIKADQIDIKESIKTMEIEITNKDFDKEESELKNNIIKINGKIDDLLILHSSNSELLGVSKHASKKIEKSKEKIKEHKTNLTLTETSIESIELVKEAFGQNGIKAIMIDYVIPQLEDKINNILSQLSDFRIRLETQKSGIGKETVLEGLFIGVTNGEGEGFDFDSFSGGEKLKIITAISEALSEIQKIGFRVLDELFIGLDDESIDSFIQVMITLKKRFSQLICISHLQGIKDIFEEKITVTKTNGNSLITN